MNKAQDKYTGINIQYPISELILTGQKTIETRTYPIPEQYVNQRMIIIETPGKKGRFKSRMVGFVTFGRSFKYRTKAEFYDDCSRHCVTKDSIWAWHNGDKWGWPILEVAVFRAPLPLKKKGGIIYSTNIALQENELEYKEC
jgi:hypothetical protein